MSRLTGRGVLVRVLLVAACGLAAITVAPAAHAFVVVPEVLRVVQGGTDASCVTGCATISQAVGVAAQDLATGAASTVTILVGPGSYDDHVMIPAGPITIEGAGATATTVRGGLSGTVFTVSAGATAVITDLAITGGVAPSGGGVVNDGTLTMQRDTIAFNAATGQPTDAGMGGGILDRGTLELDDSELLGNQAQWLGGGIATFSGANGIAHVTLARDLITDNFVAGTSPAQGGGLGFDWASATVRDSTIVGNVVAGGNWGGGGLSGALAAVTLVGDTLADNRAPAGGGTLFLGDAGGGEAAGTIIAGNDGRDCGDPLYSVGHNLDGDGSCFGQDPGPGDLLGVDPRLGALVDNGGPTKTLAIGTDSPAYDAVPAGASLDPGVTFCDATDQRGISQLQRGATRCDIGAFQVAAPTLYVGNPGANSITAYPPGANGDATPTLTLAGPETGLDNPNGIALDVTGDVFVANAGANSITEYAPEATGDSAPVATIAGPLTGLDRPSGLARDDAGDLFVANADNSTVTEYAPGAAGNVAPKARIAGARTRLVRPAGLVVDPKGALRVANDNDRITVYAAGANGNVAPKARVSGGLSSAWGLAFDGAGRLLVSDAGANQVAAFDPRPRFESAPLSTLTGASPGLASPVGIDVDDADDLFVASSQSSTVTEYPPGARGAAVPLATITGPHTGLSVPLFLAELPPAPFPVVRTRRLGHRSLARVVRGGLPVSLHANGALAFHSAPLRVTGVLRVGRRTIARGHATIARAGRTVLTLLPVRHAPRRLGRGRLRRAVVRLTLRHASEVRTRRLALRLTR